MMKRLNREDDDAEYSADNYDSYPDDVHSGNEMAPEDENELIHVSDSDNEGKGENDRPAKFKLVNQFADKPVPVKAYDKKDTIMSTMGEQPKISHLNSIKSNNDLQVPGGDQTTTSANDVSVNFRSTVEARSPQPTFKEKLEMNRLNNNPSVVKP